MGFGGTTPPPALTLPHKGGEDQKGSVPLWMGRVGMGMSPEVPESVDAPGPAVPDRLGSAGGVWSGASVPAVRDPDTFGGGPIG